MSEELQGQTIIENGNQEGSEVGQEANIQESTAPTSQMSQTETSNVKPTAQEILDWTKDPRYKTSWKGDANKFYGSYREMEKVYAPLKSKYENINKTLEEHGFSSDQIQDILKEYKTFKDPNNPVIQKSQYFDNWLNDSEFSPAIISFFQDLENQKMQKDYPGLTKEQIEKQIALEQEVNNFKQIFEKQEFDKTVQTNSQKISTELERVQKKCEEVGMPYSEEVKNKILEYCMQDKENPISPQFIYRTFLELYENDLWKAFNDKSEKNTLNKLNKNNKDSVVFAASSSAKITPKMDNKQALLNAINKKMGE